MSPARAPRWRVALLLGTGVLCLLTETAHADGTNVVATEQSELKKLSLEELMDIEVTSVSKKAEKLSHAPAAIFVITGEDIRRSGVTSIPEALRMAPGVDVARVDAHKWAIGVRGFTDVFANKLLVLIDGRSVYTPLFSGVFWDVQDVMLEDIERIEVIRGPGAALWGANAVNGVINIITRSARDTQGGLVSAGSGTEEQAFGAARYGGKVNDTTFFRVYGKYFNRDDSALRGGGDAADYSYQGRGGFRIDSTVNTDDLLTLQGDGYAGRDGDVFTVPTLTAPFTQALRDQQDVSGANLLGRWTHLLGNDSDLVLQTYYDNTRRDAMIFGESRNTFDFDFQHRFPLGERQQIMWGGGYRVSHDSIDNSSTIKFTPDHRTMQLFSTFLQDEITLVKEHLRLTLGAKLEHNDSTGFEVQPSGRLLWTPNERHTLWAAVSRAVRTPSRAQDDVRINLQTIPGLPPTEVALFGNRDVESENLLAYELGYRVAPVDNVTLDAAMFYNVYTDLRTVESGTPFVEPVPPPLHAVVPQNLANNMEGETYGVELTAHWQALSWWRLRANYTFLDIQLHRDKTSTDKAGEHIEGNDPENQFSLRSSMDLPWHLELDGWVRYVDSLPNLNVDGYVTLDLRLAWKPNKNVEIAIVGQNLLDHRHPEFVPTLIRSESTEVQRSVYGKVTWHF